MLIECPECKHKVSEEYCSVCPNCNHRLKPPTRNDQDDRHKTAINETRKDLHEKTEEFLLTEIHEESLDRTRLPSETISRTMARFAALLVLLSRKSSEAANKNLKMQKWLIILTVFIIVLTIALLFFGVIQIRMSNRPIIMPDHVHQKIDAPNKTDTTETKKDTRQRK